jgi:hypothetical protein
MCNNVICPNRSFLLSKYIINGETVIASMKTSPSSQPLACSLARILPVTMQATLCLLSTDIGVMLMGVNFS